MGFVNENEEHAESFHRQLEDKIAKFKGLNCLVIGDFNANLGCKNADCGSIGAHARGVRKLKGDHLYKLLLKFNLISANTFFKHNRTKWERNINGKNVYNQIDYILLPHTRRHSMIRSRQ